MTKIRLALWAIFSLWLVGVTFGQDFIDGSKNPDQIPDAISFRQWAILTTSNGQIGDFHEVGLSSADVAVVTSVLQSYRSQYDTLVSERKSGQIDRDTFWQQLNQLAVRSLASVQGSASSDGVPKFNSHIQRFKAHILLPPVDPGLGAVAERNLRERRMIAAAGSMPKMPGMFQGGEMVANYTITVSSKDTVPDEGDNFNRTGTSLGSNWKVLYGTVALSSGKAIPTSGAGNYDQAVADFIPGGVMTDGCYSTEWDGGAAGPTIRTTENGANSSFYNFAESSGNNIFLLQKIINGTTTWLKSGSRTPAAGDALTICAQGTTITGFINGALFASVTDTSLSSGDVGMLLNYASSGSSIAAFDGSSLDVIYTTVTALVTGDTSPCTGNCTGATHQATVQFSPQNGIGGMYYGPGEGPTDYYDWQQSLNIPASNGPDITTNVVMHCTIAQTLTSGGHTAGMEVESATTWVKANGTPSGYPPFLIYAPVTSNCTPATTPPDFHPNLVTDSVAHPGWTTGALCFRGDAWTHSGIPWNCTVGFGIGNTVLPPPQACSNWDAGNPGIIRWGNYP